MFILAPIAIFYGGLASFGQDVEDSREEGEAGMRRTQQAPADPNGLKWFPVDPRGPQQAPADPNGPLRIFNGSTRV